MAGWALFLPGKTVLPEMPVGADFVIVDSQKSQTVDDPLWRQIVIVPDEVFDETNLLAFRPEGLNMEDRKSVV